LFPTRRGQARESSIWIFLRPLGKEKASEKICFRVHLAFGRTEFVEIALDLISIESLDEGEKGFVSLERIRNCEDIRERPGD